MMKRWMKNLAIAGTVLLLTGAGITAVVGAVHGAQIDSRYGRHIRNRVLDHIDDDDIWLYETEYTYVDERIDDDLVFNGEEAYSGVLSPKSEMYEAARFKNVMELSVDAEAATIRVVENPELDNEIVFYAKDKPNSEFRYETEDGGREISVDYTVRRGFRHTGKFSGTYAEGIVEIPVGYHFQSIEFSAAASDIKIDTLSATELQLDSEAGRIQLDAFEADALKTDVSAGTIVAKGEVARRIEAESNVGQTQLLIKGKETDYAYHMELSLGQILIGKTEYSGFNGEKRLGSGAPKIAELECKAGSIELSFYE